MKEEELQKGIQDSTLQVINTKNGTVMSMEDFINSMEGKVYWEKTKGEYLSKFLNASGSKAVKVLAFLLERRDARNYVHTTIKEISDTTRVTRATVNKMFKQLYKEELLKKVRNGSYMLNPNIIRAGSDAKGIMLMCLWEGEG